MADMLDDPAAGIGSFEGPEKTVTLCFRSSKMVVASLRLIPQESWSEVLKHARCQILSCVQSGPAELIPHPNKKDKKMCTGKITGYLLSESSLFLSDNTLTLKTCGRTTPLLALEPILDMVVPTWRDKHPSKYLKYTSFTRLGYRFPEDQPEQHASWSHEVDYLDKYFIGESVVLGSLATATYHAYVANYLPKGYVLDATSTQVALGDLHPEQSMCHFVEARAIDKTPLKSAWQEMHGSEPRSIVAEHQIDECFFDPIGYSANAVFDRRFTTVHATPQPCSSYVSVETSLPLTKEATQRFVHAAQSMCRADTLSLTEFALCPPAFSVRPEPPEISGFQVVDSSHNTSSNFACALHYYVRKAAGAGLTGLEPTPEALVASPMILEPLLPEASTVLCGA